MLTTLHLVRHGEVHNPAGVVYAGLDGFGLSADGVAQAEAAAMRLSSQRVDVVASSPLARAMATATPIAAALGRPIDIDDRLTEWALANRWEGTPWEALPDRFPGELEAYLTQPTDLRFSSESIAEVADRIHQVVADLGDRHPLGTAVVVSHQDPIQAIRLLLVGRNLAQLHVDKPQHASIITLQAEQGGWRETANWAPPQPSRPFPPVDESRPT